MQDSQVKSRESVEIKVGSTQVLWQQPTQSLQRIQNHWSSSSSLILPARPCSCFTQCLPAPLWVAARSGRTRRRPTLHSGRVHSPFFASEVACRWRAPLFSLQRNGIHLPLFGHFLQMALQALSVMVGGIAAFFWALKEDFCRVLYLIITIRSIAFRFSSSIFARSTLSGGEQCIFPRPSQRPRVCIRTLNFVTVCMYVRMSHKNIVPRGYVEI